MAEGDASSPKWTTIVKKQPLGPHRQHFLDIERTVDPNAVYSHVRLTIFPDGGIKRLRINGYPVSASASFAASTPFSLPALPFTYEAFKPYGQVIQGYSLPTSSPKGIDATTANQGTAAKFHRMARVEETYPAGLLKRGGLHVSVTRSPSRLDISQGAVFPVTMLERHACTTQAFIPMGKGQPDGGVEELPQGGAYVVVVALNGSDDKPDLTTMRAFLATQAQGVSYDAGIWHHNLSVVDAALDFAVVEAQVDDPGFIMDCEILRPVNPFATVEIPPYTARPAQAKVNGTGHSNGINGTNTLNGALDTVTSLLPSLPALDSIVHPVTITPEAFAPYGQLIRAHPDPSNRAPTMEVQSNAKTGSAKYVRLATLTDNYPAGVKAVRGVGVYRSTPKAGLERGKVFDIRLMERHPYTSQAFIPMGKGEVSPRIMSVTARLTFSGKATAKKHSRLAARS